LFFLQNVFNYFLFSCVSLLAFVKYKTPSNYCFLSGIFGAIVPGNRVAIDFDSETHPFGIKFSLTFAYRPLVEKGFSVNVVGLSDILLLENHDNEKKVSLGVFLD